MQNQHAKKSVSFINSLLYISVYYIYIYIYIYIYSDSRVPRYRKWHTFLTTATQKEVTVNMTGSPLYFESQQNTKQLQQFFLNILQRYFQLPILGTLEISGHLHQTCQLVATLSACKNATPFQTSFLRY